MKPTLPIFKLALAGCLALAHTARAWDYEGHRVVNQLALASLPTNFPAFVRTPAAQERIAFLSGEPDRWRNTPDFALQHFNNPDHYLDIEELADFGLKPDDLTPFRYNFTVQMGLARAKHPEKFEPIDPEKNKDQTRQMAGFLPWAITEYYGKLKSGFSYLSTYQQYGGTPEEIANAQANIIYIMGVMGHFVGDGSQPLHLTKHHHGWVGDNPKGYSTNRTFHSWIDGGYFRRIGGVKASDLASSIKPAQNVGNTNQPAGFFNSTMDYLMTTFTLVEPLYQLEKENRLSSKGDIDPAGKTFLEERIVAGGQMLGNIWYTAWINAHEDKYLRGELEKRQGRAAEPRPSTPPDAKVKGP